MIGYKTPCRGDLVVQSRLANLIRRRVRHLFVDWLLTLILFISFDSRAVFCRFFFRRVYKLPKAKLSYEIVQALIVDVQLRILKWLVYAEIYINSYTQRT